MASLRQAASSLTREDARLPRIVKILHPDYPAAENTLLHLRALDDGGIDYDIALVACSIVTGNTSTGFFAVQNANGPRLERIARPDDNILRGFEYVFQLPDDHILERPYPVVPRFEDWTFPHASMPSPWDELSCQAAGAESCRITDCMWGLERAHILPITVQGWWDREGLEQ